jgi:hypothetical protein
LIGEAGFGSINSRIVGNAEVFRGPYSVPLAVQKRASGRSMVMSSKLTYRELAPKSRRGKDYAGTDFIVARNGRIASVYLFFDELP